MLDKRLAAEILDEALVTGGDFAEIFVEDSKFKGLALGNGKVETAQTNLLHGIGIRVFKGLFQTYAYTNLMDRENLLKTARKAASALDGTRTIRSINLVDLEFEDKHKIKYSPFLYNRSQEAEVCRQVSENMFKKSPLLVRTDIKSEYKSRKILIANSEGVWAEDEQNYMRLVIEGIAQKGTNSASAVDFNTGGLIGSEIFSTYKLDEIAENVVQRAVNKLSATDCPSGIMPVVIANGWGGVIFHEACGHGLEATSVATGSSVFANKEGKKIASDIVSAVDDATIPNAWGSINIDDEGTPTKRKVLIENGILKNYMIDKFNGRRMGKDSNGSARRQNYMYIPTSRMSNTMILNGKSTEEEIIAATKEGIFAKIMGGGNVNSVTGAFNFTVEDAFLIENGKITKQVKGVKLIGRGQDILPNIDMVADNMWFGGCEYCGSISGQIPTTVGQPTIRVQGLTVGGQK